MLSLKNCWQSMKSVSGVECEEMWLNVKVNNLPDLLLLFFPLSALYCNEERPNPPVRAQRHEQHFPKRRAVLSRGDAG